MDSLPTYKKVTIDQLFGAINDPVIEKLYADMNGIVELINELGGVSSEDLTKFVEEFDSKWPHMRQAMLVSGVLYELRDHEPVRVACDDTLVVSNGFTLLSNHIKIDGEVVAEQYRLAHHLILVDDNGGAAGYGYAFIDEAICSYSTDSVELSQNRLELHFPDLIDAIDERVYNASSPEAALLALDGLCIEGDPDDEEHRLAVVDVQQYIDRAMDFDPVLPYIFACHGSIIIEDDESTLHRTADMTLAGYITARNVLFLPSVDQPEDKEVLIPHLQCTLHGAKRGTMHHLLVPIGQIDCFSSLRDHYL